MSKFNRLLVIDQNYLRADCLGELLRSHNDLRIVLPDIAMLEMLKSGSWKSTMQRSLATLSGFANRVHVSTPIGVAIKKEIESGRVANEGMIDCLVTRWLRELLREISDGQDGSKTEAIAERILAVQQEVVADELNGEANKEKLQQLVQTLKTVISEESLKALRAGKVAREERLAMIKKAAPYFLTDVFRRAQFSQNKAKSFLRQKPILLRFTYARIWLSIDWLSRGGIETANGATITNDFIDQDYVVTATCFNGILSKERRVNAAFEDLQGVMTHNLR
ncbi:hypothetical protein LGR64_10475 [Delftia sp. Lp-1]|uniref:hypothetical protein n=1 Tax=Delftia sp. Lp-1 TaxID=682863 RepID=UPI001E4E55F9|nr:hypothetical protein [Delftia sp. Lp-1]MCB4786697.1 hypothetical protein [Delftia sp. Lp-1]